jgi:hypothetical protein
MLTHLGLVVYEEDDWWLTMAGEMLLPDLLEGNEIGSLIWLIRKASAAEISAASAHQAKHAGALMELR